jgi:hypothetical protein
MDAMEAALGMVMRRVVELDVVSVRVKRPRLSHGLGSFLLWRAVALYLGKDGRLQLRLTLGESPLPFLHLRCLQPSQHILFEASYNRISVQSSNFPHMRIIHQPGVW